ncbi:hypothetical protein PUN28_002655 [Cardiocondyla obscurior]|uniref:Uncharacterized protein n=1 Tax=Cardiocondyla obscurior TaxID=286306 RepID=A0AAW2GVD1_9HYME
MIMQYMESKLNSGKRVTYKVSASLPKKLWERTYNDLIILPRPSFFREKSVARLSRCPINLSSISRRSRSVSFSQIEATLDLAQPLNARPPSDVLYSYI